MVWCHHQVLLNVVSLHTSVDHGGMVDIVVFLGMDAETLSMFFAHILALTWGILACDSSNQE